MALDGSRLVRKYVSPPSRSSHDKDLELRSARPGDRAFVRDLSATVFDIFGEYDTFLPNYLDHPSVYTTLCERAGQPVGFVMVALVVSTRPLPEALGGEGPGGGAAPRAKPDDEDDEDDVLDAEIVAIAVTPDQQGTGVGKRLLQHALDFADGWHATCGVRSVQLNVADTNSRARRFFERVGFVEVNPCDGTYPKGQRSIRMARRAGN
jgi:ribosomal protein S18 acetylase RimI-like enzyme